MDVTELSTVPNGYNGSLLPDGDGYIFAFRHEKNISYSPHFISLCRLDHNFNIISRPVKILNKCYDPRLFRFNGRIYLSCTNHYRMQICRIVLLPVLNRYFVANQSEIWGADFDLAPLEKNWLPFEYENSIYAIYSFSPHRIVRINPSAHLASLVSSVPVRSPWKYGQIFGGSLPIPYDEDEYITFFHSWTADGSEYRHFSRQYHLGAYTFQNKPPFKIKRMTAKPLSFPDLFTSPQGFIHKVVFPTTTLPAANGFLLVYGENDFTTKIRFISHRDIKDRLKLI